MTALMAHITAVEEEMRFIKKTFTGGFITENVLNDFNFFKT